MAKTPLQRLPWAMALIAFIVGIPMFFEVGVVILIPVVLFAARRAKAPVVLLGIPALAGLSTLHAFVPPHPGPLTAIGALNANLGITLGTRPARSHPNRNHLRPDLQQTRSQVGTNRRSGKQG